MMTSAAASEPVLIDLALRSICRAGWTTIRPKSAWCLSNSRSQRRKRRPGSLLLRKKVSRSRARSARQVLAARVARRGIQSAAGVLADGFTKKGDGRPMPSNCPFAESDGFGRSTWINPAIPDVPASNPAPAEKIILLGGARVCTGFRKSEPLRFLKEKNFHFAHRRSR
jgi:hypothetical protein